MKTRTLLLAAASLCGALFLTACGDSSIAVSEKTALLMGGPEGKGKYWYYHPEATKTAREAAIKEGTGITAEINLEGDVGAIADTLSEKHLVFYLNKDKTRYMWQITSGEGIFESQDRGYWKWDDEGETTLTMSAGEEPNPETDRTWKVEKADEGQLVLRLQSDTTIAPRIYGAEPEG